MLKKKFVCMEKAFQYCSAKFGSQYLQECFGLSITQSARYARIGEELLDLQVLNDKKQQKIL